MAQQNPWWKTGIIYQIYPRSFQDSNGDGIGDLNGITQRLEYVSSLHVDAIWISPVYPSPMADFGYDVSDYVNIHPIFGILDDFNRLLGKAHSLGIKVLMDLVPNHTSSEHPWFIESRSSLDNPKRDWYIWRSPKPDGSLPNNWLSSFGGSAWEWDEGTGQYYLHSFVKQQPDLNYRNPEVLQAMLDAMRFWLDRGVDGFRVDVITAMIKEDRFLDEPENPAWDGVVPYNRLKHIYTNNQPDVHNIIRKMRSILDAYPERVMVGEIWGLPNEELVKYYGKNQDECQLPFNFGFIRVAWDAATLRSRIVSYERALPKDAWPNWVLGNHDQHRIASRVGPKQARVAQMLLLTLRGTPTAYYGDEIGMEDVPIPFELAKDPPAVNQPEIAHIVGRDPERTPMQWDSSVNSGFCPAGVNPWLPVGRDSVIRNVSMAEADPFSILNLFRALAILRQSYPALQAGPFRLVSTNVEGDVLAYLREAPTIEDDSFLVVLNISSTNQVVELQNSGSGGEIVLSTDLEESGAVNFTGGLRLKANQGLLIRLKKA